MEHKKFIFDVGFSGISLVITIIIGFIASVILARFFGPGGLGLYRTTFVVYGIVMLFASFAIPTALVKYVSENKENKKKLIIYISCSFVNSFILGLAAGVVLFFLSGLISTFFKMPELSSLLKVLAIIFPFSSLFNTQIGVLNGLRRMKDFAFFSIMQKSLMVILMTILIVLGFGPMGAIAGLIASMFFSSTICFFFLKSFFVISIPEYTATTRELLSFSKNLFGANVTNLIQNNIDTLLIAYFLTATEVGYYSIAIGLLHFFPLIPSAIQTVTYPATSSYLAKNNNLSLNIMLDKSIKYSTILIIPLGLFICFFGKEIIIFLYGKEYIYALLPAYILLAARVIRGSMIVPIGGSLSAAGKSNLVFRFTLISAIADIILNILLIPKYGIIGAAVATTSSLLLDTGLSLFFTIKILRFKFDYKWYSSIFGLMAISLITFILLKGIISIYIIGSLILAVFVSLIYKVFMPPEDKKHLIKLLIETVKIKR